MGDGELLKLKSSQGEIFEVEPEVACMSTLIKNMVDDSGTDEEIPLPNVKTAILSKVIDYCKYHKDNPPEEIQKPLKSTNLMECGVSEWDSEYVNIEQEVLFELILAANYLDIKSLLDLTCAKVASMIKGKTTEEIRKQFNIVNDFTPEEEAQVREENRWCEDAWRNHSKESRSSRSSQPDALASRLLFGVQMTSEQEIVARVVQRYRLVTLYLYLRLFRMWYSHDTIATLLCSFYVEIPYWVSVRLSL